MNEEEATQLMINDQNRVQRVREALVRLVLRARLVLCALYILFQLSRLFFLVMFAIFLFDCTLYHDSTSVDCENFTVYNIPKCDGFCWKAIWLICSIVTSIVLICLLNRQFLPNLRPLKYKEIWKRLIQEPYFWTLIINTAVVVLYDVLIMIQNPKAKISVECLVVASKLGTWYLIYQLNFTFPPCRENIENFRSIYRAAYCITLSIFALDNLCRLSLVSVQVAFKFYTVNDTAPKPLAIIDLMLMVLNGSLYHTFFQFFWQKLFRGKEDILKVIKNNFDRTSGIRENMQDYAAS